MEAPGEREGLVPRKMSGVGGYHRAEHWRKLRPPVWGSLARVFPGQVGLRLREPGTWINLGGAHGVSQDAGECRREPERAAHVTDSAMRWQALLR